MNRCLVPVTRTLVVALVTACLTTVSLAQGGPPQGPPGGMGVTVLNTPLPVTQGGPWTVQVVNPSNAPTATDIAKAMGIQHPYQTSVICKWNGGNGCTVDTIKAPANQRIVIEYVSGLCGINLGQQVSDVNLLTIAGGVIAVHDLTVVNPAGVVRGGEQEIAFGQMVRVYADQNTTIGLEVTSTNVSSSASCVLALSGQAVDVP